MSFSESPSPPSNQRLPQVVVVGGGWCGMVTAINLVRLSRTRGTYCQITVINAGSPLVRGVAYSTVDDEHLLTLPAHVMSPFVEEPDHLVQWLTTNCNYQGLEMTALRDVFLSRKTYGDYLVEIAQEYILPSQPQQQDADDHTYLPPSKLAYIKIIDGEAIDVSGSDVLLADGRKIEADFLVLATGNEPPAAFAGADQAEVSNHPGWCPNPWADFSKSIPLADEDGNSGTAASSCKDDVVVLGTGLTTIDVVLTLLKTDNFKGTIHAISKHGILPSAHYAPNAGDALTDATFPPPGVDLLSLSLDELVKLVHSHCVRVRENGGHPARLIFKLGPQVMHIWQGFSTEDKLKFIKDYSTIFRTLRQHIAPAAHAKIVTALAEGRFRITKGHVTRIIARDDKTLCALVNPTSSESDPIGVLDDEAKDQSAADTIEIEGAMMINCTGPVSRLSKTKSPILINMLKRKLIFPDDVDMGLLVNVADLSVPSSIGESVDLSSPPISPITDLFRAESSPATRIYVVGPLLRGVLWDSVAVPNVRTQAACVANAIYNHLETLDQKRRSNSQ